MIGEQILNYRIQAKIGEGGMGSVYLAIHTQLHRKAAIKALHPTFVNNLQIRERFKNEAATMAHLRHPNIVGLYDYLETSNGLYLIMEYVEGSPLDVYISETTGPLPEARAIKLFSKVLDGFEYAHNQSVIHRDIKPSNLIIAPADDIKILDFGIAKLLDGSNKNLTKTGSRMGTVLYMSPEQVKGLPVDRRSDIYALGVTLFQMLTGRPPYDEINATEYDVYNQIVNDPLPRAKLFYPTVSDRLQAILDKATAKDPNHRFQNCNQFKAALLGTSTLHEASDSVGRQHTVLSNPRNDFPKKQSRNTVLLASIIIVLLVSAFSLVVMFNPFRIQIFERFAILSTHNTTKPADIEFVKNKIKAFFQAQETHDFDNIQPYYSNEIEVYYNKTDLSLVPDLKSAQLYYWNNNAQEERHDIAWESLEYHQDEAGNHIVFVDIDYHFTASGEQGNYLARFQICFNTAWKIYYINK